MRSKLLYAEISIATKIELPKRKENWKFNWKSLYEENSMIYKLNYEEDIQGLLKMSLVEEGYYEMKNLELSPKNYGSKGKYGKVTGCLLAYACLLTFELNPGKYQGFLSFKSKGELITHYESMYRAELVFRDRMIISPPNGIQLIKEYLNIEI